MKKPEYATSMIRRSLSIIQQVGGKEGIQGRLKIQDFAVDWISNDRKEGIKMTFKF